MAAKLLILVCFTVLIHLSESVLNKRTHALKSVPDLEKSMYMNVDGYPCVRLLNISGEIGCSNPGRGKVFAPVISLTDAEGPTEPSAVLISMDEFQSFFTRLLNDVNFSSNIAGVLVKSGAESLTQSQGFSPDKKFPQAEFSPYPNLNYEWNPIGSGLMWNSFNIPVFLLSESSSLTLQEVAIKNKNSRAGYTMDVAEFDMVMQTTKVGTRDSQSCLTEETCLPLGGYSVWSSLPPLNVSSTVQSKRIILAMASMDSASFFRDKSTGAESSISGLISLLAAVDALSYMNDFSELNKQLVFIVFTGESWGYLGSRRFLLELDLQSDAVRGLNSTLIDQIIEIGSVGKGFRQGFKSIFAHTTETKVSSASNSTLRALHLAQESLKPDIEISTANASNPGVPPSSMMAFLRKNPMTSGVVLEDFDAEFSNKFYHSHLDHQSNINSSAIVAAASLVARTLYILANEDKSISTSMLSAIKVNESLVEELVSCLVSCDPGLSCKLVKNYISPSKTCPSHYVGVILGEPSSTPSLGNVDQVSRFVWNFLADKTSSLVRNSSSTCPKSCSKAGEVCIKTETDGKGVCVVSTTRYVPAYSTRLKYESGTWSVLPSKSSDPMGAVDPIWTESFWNVIGVRVYTVQNSAFDNIVLLGGLGITVLAYFGILSARALIDKILKQD